VVLSPPALELVYARRRAGHHRPCARQERDAVALWRDGAVRAWPQGENGPGFNPKAHISASFDGAAVTDIFESPQPGERTVDARGQATITLAFKNLAAGEYTIPMRFTAMNSADDDAQRLTVTLQVRNNVIGAILVLILAALLSFLATRVVTGLRQRAAALDRMRNMRPTWLAEESASLPVTSASGGLPSGLIFWRSLWRWSRRSSAASRFTPWRRASVAPRTILRSSPGARASIKAKGSSSPWPPTPRLPPSPPLLDEMVDMAGRPESPLAPFEILSDSDLMREFVSCAIERENAMLDGTMRDVKRATYRMFALDDLFSARGSAVQKLLPFLDHRNEGVRYWSVRRLLPIAPAKARSTLEQVASGVGPIAADVRCTLRELDGGQFKPETLWAPIDE